MKKNSGKPTALGGNGGWGGDPHLLLIGWLVQECNQLWYMKLGPSVSGEATSMF